MNVIIVDASVAVKWFVPEIQAAEARGWRYGSDELTVSPQSGCITLGTLCMLGRRPTDGIVKRK